MSTGSPTSTLSLNRIPFVVRPSFTSRQTITRLLSKGRPPHVASFHAAIPGKEIGKKLHSERTGLLEMELKCYEVPPGDAGGKAQTVFGLPCDDARVRRVRVVGVHEIKRRILRDALENRVRPGEMHRVPAHMRNLEPGCSGKTAHRPFEKAEALRVPLLGPLEDHLAADTDAEDLP